MSTHRDTRTGFSDVSRLKRRVSRKTRGAGEGGRPENRSVGFRFGFARLLLLLLHPPSLRHKKGRQTDSQSEHAKPDWGTIRDDATREIR